MKLLKMSFDHLKMFENGVFSVDFYAQDKVPSSDSSVYELQRPLYSNNVIAFAGINASGKTTALNLIDLACRIASGRPVNHQGLPASMPELFDGSAQFKCAIYHEKYVYLICSNLLVVAEGNIGNPEPRLVFDEEIVSKVHAGNLNKAALADWDNLFVNSTPIAKRSELDSIWQGSGLDDISMFATSLNSRPALITLSAIRADVSLRLRENFEGLDDILRVFDPGIKHLNVEDSGRAFTLHFEGREPIVLSERGLEEVLSSGTVRGLSLIQRALHALNAGGYLLVDEIENHLNRQLVNVIIDLFTLKNTNPKGATIVFTSHYAQLLDHVHRKDNVYFIVKKERRTSEAVKYSDKVQRIENKKSEVFASNYVRGTAPRYTDVRKLQKLISRTVDGNV